MKKQEILNILISKLIFYDKNFYIQEFISSSILLYKNNVENLEIDESVNKLILNNLYKKAKRLKLQKNIAFISLFITTIIIYVIIFYIFNYNQFYSLSISLIYMLTNFYLVYKGIDKKLERKLSKKYNEFVPKDIKSYCKKLIEEKGEKL